MFVALVTTHAGRSPTVADALALVGLALVWLVYQLQRRSDIEGSRASARAALSATRDGLGSWSNAYFDDGYTVESAKDRAREDVAMISGKKNYNQVLRIPTEPLAALVMSPENHHVSQRTIKAANFALWRFGVFNQLVGQQTDFHSLHLAEIMDADLPDERRTAIAGAAFSISWMLHSQGVGDVAFYRELEDALAENIGAHAERPWWRSWALDFAVLLLIAAVVLVAWSAQAR